MVSVRGFKARTNAEGGHRFITGGRLLLFSFPAGQGWD
jgi:hypothetical protein